MCQGALEVLAGGKRHERDGVLASGIKHARLEIDGGVLGSDAGEVARGRMTRFATTGSIEKHLSGLRISRQQLFQRILGWEPRGTERFGSTRMEKRGDVEHLRVGQRHR